MFDPHVIIIMILMVLSVGVYVVPSSPSKPNSCFLCSSKPGPPWSSRYNLSGLGPSLLNSAHFHIIMRMLGGAHWLGTVRW